MTLPNPPPPCWRERATIEEAVSLIESYGMTDGAHHKQWLLDQVVRRLTGDAYPIWRKQYARQAADYSCDDWDEGIAP